eukprot:GHVP01026753.1.p1 GENE.GHVP01026753.1~~GHVP01026753.1.p1  ORF type:complete len:516 (+),score=73.69 GHVP01026753.1:2-1549(+)
MSGLGKKTKKNQNWLMSHLQSGPGLSPAVDAENHDYPKYESHRSGIEQCPSSARGYYQENPNVNQKSAALRLRGLPWSCTHNDIMDFFGPITNLSSDDIRMVTGQEGRPTGEAFVLVADEDVRDHAMKQLHGKHVGKRWVEVFRASVTEFDQCVEGGRVSSYATPKDSGGSSWSTSSYGQYNPMGGGAYDDRPVYNVREDYGGDDMGSSRRRHSDGSSNYSDAVLRLRGLPWSATELDVVRFFQNRKFQISSQNVAMGYTRDGRLTGEAWVLLDSSSTAEEARRILNKGLMGRRYIEIFPSSVYEMENAKAGGPGRHQRIAQNQPYPAARARPMTVVSTDGHPYDDRYPRGGSGSGSFLTTGGSYGCLRRERFLPMNESRNNEYGGRLHAGRDPAVLPPPGLSADNSHGSSQEIMTVLRMRGLPFSCNEHHILEFFKGFAMMSVLPSTVPVEGRPSGEAYVEFDSANESMRALQERNKAVMERRYIELFPASKQEMNLAAAGHTPRDIKAIMSKK